MQTKKENLYLREDFLRSFIKVLIENYPLEKKEELNEEEIFQKMPEPPLNLPELQEKRKFPIFRLPHAEIPIPLPTPKIIIQGQTQSAKGSTQQERQFPAAMMGYGYPAMPPVPINQQFYMMPGSQPYPYPMPPRRPQYGGGFEVSPIVTPATVQYMPSRQNRNSISNSLTIANVAKFQALLTDPDILSVECPGPDRPVIVNKAGAMQTTNVILTADEINTIMKEVSEKTKIPLVSGVFKAALGNILITAVISEYVGTRFIIQKLNLFG